MPSTEPNALLPVENRSGRSESCHHHEQDHQRQPNRQREENERDIESRFPTRYPVYRQLGKVDRNKRSFRSVPVQSVVGQAAALGRSPDMREMAFYPHVMTSNRSNPLTVRDRVSEERFESRSSVHQGNVTEERLLEKFTLKNLNTGGQCRERKLKSDQ